MHQTNGPPTHIRLYHLINGTPVGTASGFCPPHKVRAKPSIASGTWEWVESLLCEERSPKQINVWLSGQ